LDLELVLYQGNVNTHLKGLEREEVKHGTIDFTGDLRNIDDAIIEFRFVDNRWEFTRTRNFAFCLLQASLGL